MEKIFCDRCKKEVEEHYYTCHVYWSKKEWKFALEENNDFELNEKLHICLGCRPFVGMGTLLNELQKCLEE